MREQLKAAEEEPGNIIIVLARNNGRIILVLRSSAAFKSVTETDNTDLDIRIHRTQLILSILKAKG